MNEARYQSEIEQSWGRVRKAEIPPKKTRSQRGKGLSGDNLLSIVAHAARDAGMILFRKSPHRKSFYLKVAGSQFKLRISDHKYSGFSKQRHMSVILDFIVSGPMDSKQAIELGNNLFERYKERCEKRMKEASRAMISS